MPSITYTEEPKQHKSSAESISGTEPSAQVFLYDPHNNAQPDGNEPQAPQTPQGNLNPQGGNWQDPEYDKLRHRILAAQIIALVSLVIGGVLFGVIALVLAITAYRKASEKVQRSAQQGEAVSWEFVQRSAKVAIAMAGLALALNAISLIILYPMVVEMLQSGDYSQIFGDAVFTGTSSSRSSVWG